MEDAMRAIRPVALLCLLVIFATAAASADRPDTTSATLPGLTVSGTPLPWLGGAVPADLFAARPGANLGEQLEDLPGLAMVRRAPSGTEPVLRGLGGERVRTLLGAVPLYGACPGHMDPPVTYLSGTAAAAVDVTCCGTADAGAGGNAGAVTVDPDYARADDAPDGWRPWVEAGWESARDGGYAGGGVAGGQGALDLKAGVAHRSLDDYTAPDGRVVPASLTETTADLSVGWRPARGRRLWTALNYAKEKDIAYVAMPMDNRDTDFLAWNLGWRAEGCGAVDSWEITAGLSTIDHLMDNRDKPTWTTMHASTDGRTDTWAARARVDLAPGAFTLRLGADVTEVRQDALRTRTMTATGMSAYDHMWPDGRQATYGGLAELGRSLGAATLTLEGRLDAFDSAARAADDASLGGLTVREQYVRWYGADAAETDRTETMGQAAVRLEGGDDRLGWRLRTGLATRPAGIGERYLAFAPAPGGYQVGNPSLAAEKAWQSEAGVDMARDGLELAAAVYHYAITDYILPTLVARQDVTGDGVPDAIKGWLNRDATLTGAELSAVGKPSARVRVPVTLALVRGRNTTDDRDLPEIPAFGGKAEVQLLAWTAGEGWLTCGARFAADQDRIDPVFGENRTGGWTVWHVGVEARPVASLTLRATVENLFDKLYWDHLTREAALATGGLAAGDEVPAVGRSLAASARWTF